jgi:hypothetical protein
MTDMADTVQSGPSQSSNMANKSNKTTGNGKSGLYGAVQSILGQPSTTDSPSSVSSSDTESETISTKLSQGSTNTRKRKISGLQGGRRSSPANPSSPFITDATSNNPSPIGESATAPSVGNFASYRDEGCYDTDSKASWDNEAEEILRVESEPPRAEAGALNLERKTYKRTPLPNNRTGPSNKPPRVVKSGAKWSVQEDTLLKHLKRTELPWDDISARLPGRTATACKRHYNKTLAPLSTTPRGISTPAKTSGKPPVPAPTARKRRWSDEEVDVLWNFKKSGLEWAEIAKQLPGRTARACRRKLELWRREVDIEQSEPRGVVEEGNVESGSDDGQFGNDMDEERPKRDIVEGNYSSDSDEEMLESYVDDQEAESNIKEEDPESALEDVEAESVGVKYISDTSSEEDPSESESEGETDKKRRHATFYLKR